MRDDITCAYERDRYDDGIDVLHLMGSEYELREDGVYLQGDLLLEEDARQIRNIVDAMNYLAAN